MDVPDVDPSDVPDVDHVSKKPKLSDDRQKSILTRKKESWQHKDERVVKIVDETCARMLSNGYNVWHTSKAAT